MVEGKRPPGERVVVYDGEGYRRRGRIRRASWRSRAVAVELVTPFDVVAPSCDETLEGPRCAAVSTRSASRCAATYTVLAVRAGSRRPPRATSASRSSSTRTRSCSSRSALSDDALYRELIADPDALAAEGVEAVYRIGDCVAPRHARRRRLRRPSPRRARSTRRTPRCRCRTGGSCRPLAPHAPPSRSASR